MGEQLTDSRDEEPEPIGDALPASLPWLYGPFLIVVGVLFLVMALQLQPAGMMNKRDIGPRVVPLLLASLLLAAGIFQTATAIGGRMPPSDNRLTPRLPLPGLVVVTAIVLWVILMPYLGFVATGLLFAVSMMLLMGAKVGTSLLAASAIIPAAHVLFVEVFRVLLPRGPWGF